jgi:hypothetical protein
MDKLPAEPRVTAPVAIPPPPGDDPDQEFIPVQGVPAPSCLPAVQPPMAASPPAASKDEATRIMNVISITDWSVNPYRIARELGYSE